MKHSKFSYIFLSMLCLPFMMQAQVIRISGGANMIVTGDAKIVLHDGNLVRGSLGTNATPMVFTGYSDKNALMSSKNVPGTDNILVDKSYGNAWASNDNVYIFLGKELSLNKTTPAQAFMQAWPNPVRERFTLTVSSEKATTGTILLQDENGRIIERKRVYYNAGLNTIQWNLEKLSAGSYLLVFENAPGKYLKIVKQ